MLLMLTCGHDLCYNIKGYYVVRLCCNDRGNSRFETQITLKIISMKIELLYYVCRCKGYKWSFTHSKSHFSNNIDVFKVGNAKLYFQ